MLGHRDTSRWKYGAGPPGFSLIWVNYAALPLAVNSPTGRDRTAALLTYVKSDELALRKTIRLSGVTGVAGF
jgi:hypothetical protein